MLLASPVPSPGPPGPFGTMAWLRATVSRFSNGDGARAPPRAGRGAARRRSTRRELRARRARERRVPQPGLCKSTLAYVPVAVLADALGGERRRRRADVRTVAAAYHPGTDAPGADEALARCSRRCPPAEPEVAAQRVALLVQACEATAALVRGGLERPLEDVLRDTPPVPATKRLAPDGEIVVVPLDGRPFGAGPRRCPGEAHARALAAGVIEGARGEAPAEVAR